MSAVVAAHQLGCYSHKPQCIHQQYWCWIIAAGVYKDTQTDWLFGGRGMRDMDEIISVLMTHLRAPLGDGDLWDNDREMEKERQREMVRERETEQCWQRLTASKEICFGNAVRQLLVYLITTHSNREQTFQAKPLIANCVCGRVCRQEPERSETEGETWKEHIDGHNGDIKVKHSFYWFGIFFQYSGYFSLTGFHREHR